MLRAVLSFRVVLAIVLSFLAAMLMLWDYENNRMVGLMGMEWDTGPPFWPYQAIYLLLFAINAPAFVLSMPILKLLNLDTLSLRYSVWLPAIVGWWWWVGSRIDFGIIGRRRYRHPKMFAGALATASLGLIYVAIEYAPDSFPFRIPILLRTIGLVLWCFLLAGGCVVASIRLFQVGSMQTEEKQHKFRLFLIGASFVALYVFTIHR